MAMKPMHLPESIDSHRLTLKKHRIDAAAMMFDYVERDRERLSRFLPWPPGIKSVEDEKRYIEDTHRWWKEQTLFDYGLFRKADDVYMGNLGVHSIQWRHDCCELGYWILGDFEGAGYMSEAVGALESTLFQLGFHRIEIRCDASNERSAKLPQRRGYNLDGTLRQACKVPSGYRDTMVFSKLRSEGLSPEA